MKKLIKKVVEEFIFGGHLLSIGGGGIIVSVNLIADLPQVVILPLILYLISQVVYTYNRIRELNSDEQTNPERVDHIKKSYKSFKIRFFIYLISLLVSTVIAGTNTFYFASFITIGGILYTEVFKKLGITKYLVGLKAIYISTFWALSTFIVPIYNNLPLNNLFIWLSVFVFIRFLVSTIFFDLKDIQSDKINGIRTIPILLGGNTTLILLHILNAFTFLFILFLVYSVNFPKEFLIMSFFLVYSLIYLIATPYLSSKKLRLLSYVLVDGEYILWPIFIFIVKVLI